MNPLNIDFLDLDDQFLTDRAAFHSINTVSASADSVLLASTEEPAALPRVYVDSVIVSVVTVIGGLNVRKDIRLIRGCTTPRKQNNSTVTTQE
jgi:hypothetical protein